MAKRSRQRRVQPATPRLSSTGKGVGKGVGVIFLCLEEVLANTIQYGYMDNGDHEISINISTLEEHLSNDFLDDAIAFDPTKEAPPPDVNASIKERRIGGLGVHLVKKLTESMEYARLH